MTERDLDSFASTAGGTTGSTAGCLFEVSRALSILSNEKSCGGHPPCPAERVVEISALLGPVHLVSSDENPQCSMAFCKILSCR